MNSDFQVLVTAEEAWPKFERAVLTARESLSAGFRLFDMDTRLRSAEAKSIGDTWFDLLAHVLSNGVHVTLVVSDFDPIMAPDLHEAAQRTVDQGVRLAKQTKANPDQLTVQASLHPAQAGLIPWLSFLPVVMRRRSKENGVKSTPNGRIFPEIHPVSHHQKLAVIDGEILYIGGLDLNERRYDTPHHDRPAETTWSDVQVLVKGPEARAAQRHLAEFVSVTAGKANPSPTPGLKRTLSAPRRIAFPYLSPRTVLNEIEETHVSAFQQARNLIYIETQFMRSSIIANALADAAHKNPDLHAIIIIPALPEDVAFQGNSDIDARFGLAQRSDSIETLQSAFENRLTLATPTQTRLAARDTDATLTGAPLIHIHNKVLIQDDSFALIGSANLNGRSMRWDTEIALNIDDPARVSHVRSRLFRHWWTGELPNVAVAPETQQPWWDREIQRNAVTLPKNRNGFLVPFDPSNKASLAQPLPGVTENIV